MKKKLKWELRKLPQAVAQGNGCDFLFEIVKLEEVQDRPDSRQ